MVSEANKDRLIVIAAACYWIIWILNVLQLVMEGSSFIKWAITIIFFIFAVYFTVLALRIR